MDGWVWGGHGRGGGFGEVVGWRDGGMEGRRGLGMGRGLLILIVSE